MTKEKSKVRVFVEGLGISFIVFVILTASLSYWLQPKFEKVYNDGYERGKSECQGFILNKTNQPDGIHYTDIRFNFSVNFS